GRDVPLGGLVRHGARQESLEAIVAELARNAHGDNPKGCWNIARKKRKTKRVKKPKTAMQEELERAGLLPPEPDQPDQTDDDEPDDYPAGDAITEEQEAELEPELGPKERSANRERVRREAVRAVSLKELRDEMDKATGHGSSGDDGGATRTLMEAVATAYQP